ncbi:MAG: DUF2849 domain-containing protein [Rhodobacteraceae bacterium]|nr:DUF2849 domain-containing protein [Paracoccaceae bacterium]
MTQISEPQTITANDLLTGEVVYLTKHGVWAHQHSDAVTFDHPDRAALCLEQVSSRDIAVVGPYLARAKIDHHQAVKPVHFRDAIRATGPSNRFIGKQASPA